MEKSALVRAFIANEEQAFNADEQGKFYPSNHHHLKEILKSIPGDLTDEEIAAMYYHLLRLGNLLTVKEKHYPLLQQAYLRLLPVLEMSYPRNMFHRLEMMFLFNTSEEGIVQTGYEDYQRYREVIMQCNKYTNLPGMRSKPAKFQPYAEDEVIVARIIDALQRIGFQHNGPLVSNFTFWGFIFILLLNKSEAALSAVTAFIQTDLPEKRSNVWILGSFLKAMKMKTQLDLLYASFPVEWTDEYL